MTASIRPRFDFVFAVLIAAATMSSAALAAPPYTDSQAVAAITPVWTNVSYSWWLGSITVVRPGYGHHQGHAITQSVLKNSFIPLRNAGLITITEDSASRSFNSGQSFSWGQWMQATQRGVQTKVNVALTPLGREVNTGSSTVLRIPIGPQEITRIASSEAVRKGIDDYRVVRLLYTIQWNKYLKRVLFECGHYVTEAQKAVVLLRYDGFSNKWKYVTEDDANAADSICTNKVANYLARH